MSKQIIASAKKDFWSSLNIPLASHPVACKIANIILIGELFSEKTILAFGKYDLILCYRKGENEFGPVYDTTVITRTFCENLPVIGSGISGVLPGALEVSTRFSRPLRAHVRTGKPANLKIRDLVKTVISYTTWVEVQLEGEIIAEIAPAQEIVQEAVPVAPAEEKTGDKTQSEKEKHKLKLAAEIIQNLDYKEEEVPPEAKADDLSEQDGKARQRKEVNRSGTEKEVSGSSDKEAETLKNIPKENQYVDPEMLAGLVMKIIRQRDEEMIVHQETIRKNPEKARPRAGYPAHTSVTIPHPAPHPLSLEQIPSRPGLHKTFTQGALPPKPPGKDG